MGHGFRWWCGVGAVLGWSAGARGEDIGHDPLAPRDGAASLSLRGPSASSDRGEPGGSGAAVLAPRGPAVSEHPQADEAIVQHPRRRWYGWQTLIVDGVATTALIAVAARNSSESPDAWLTGIAVTYAVVPPVIHLAHGHPGKAILSLGIRSIGPLLIASAVSNHANAGLGVFGVLSIPAVIAIDAAAVAREDVTPEDASAFGRGVAFSPWLDPRRGAGGIAIGLRL